MRGGGEGVVECSPRIFCSDAGFTLKHNGLRGVLFAGSAPSHEIPQSLVMSRDFFNFIIKEFPFSLFSDFTEIFPVTVSSVGCTLYCPSSCTRFIPPALCPI